MNSLSFNGIRKPYLLVTGRKRSYWAPRNLVLTQNRKIGARLRKIKTGARIEEVHVEISTIEGLDIRKTAEDLAGWLLTEFEKELIFDDESDRTYHAVVEGGFDAEEIVTVGYGVIRFVCPDPHKFGPTNTLNLTTSLNTFEIKGQTETPWSSETLFSAPASKYELEFDSGGKIILNYNFITGDLLEVDYEFRSIKLNGKNLAVSLSLESVWKPLDVGFMQIKSSHPTTLKYNERYY